MTNQEIAGPSVTLPAPGPALTLHQAAAKLRTAAEAMLDHMIDNPSWESGWWDNVNEYLGGPPGELCGLLSPQLALVIADHLDTTAVEAVRHAAGFGNLQEEITDGYPTAMATRILGAS